MSESIGPGRLRQGAIYRDGISGVRPKVPTSWPAHVARAESRMSREGAAYITGGAGSESTIANNRNGFDEWQIVPRVLRDVSRRDLSVELLGRILPAPLLLAPVGVSSMAHSEADVGAAKAAAAQGVPMVFSNQASRSMEECAAVMGDSPRWFQLYWSTVDDLVESFIRRAEACGCEALVVTLDTTMLGWRSRDLDLGSLPFAHGWGIAQYTSDPVFQALVAERIRTGRSSPRTTEDRPKVSVAAIRTLMDIARAHPGSTRDNLRSPVPRAAVQTFMDIYSRPSITWADLAWLRARTNLPIVVKGILHPDDARLAVDHGVDGLIVSTHGGRQVDGSIGAVQALPGVVEAVGGRVPVLMDSGVRSGADVFKAINLGADAVLIGRAWAYGLAIAGSNGVRDVIRNIIGELDLTMGLTGCASLGDVRGATLRRREHGSD
jgi:isopentenyl diphosphate isomerase/L-lactate dehydrogenase-like FMN-dependent dehydrogenase